MSVIHPILARHYELFIERMKDHQAQEHPRLTPEDRRHRELRLAWAKDTIANSTSVRYFKIYYCPDCMHGHIADMTYNQVGDDAHAIGVINKSTSWVVLCPARKEAI